MNSPARYHPVLYTKLLGRREISYDTEMMAIGQGNLLLGRKWRWA
jgi:hypothetical protein